MAAAAGADLPVLPDSVLLRVLALLPLRDRLRAARVCRRWQQLALDRTVWRHVDLSPHRISSRILWQLVRRQLRDSLRTLRLRGTLSSSGKERLLSPALLAALGKRCPQLHRLCLAETDLRPVPYESIPPSLTVLELSRCEIPAAWFCGSAASALPQLQHLIVHHVPAFSDRHLLNISSRSRLKTLSLSGTYRLTDAGIQKAAPHLEELERLVLRCCVIGDSAMDFVGRHMKHLRFLEISNACSLTNAGLAALATLRCLETLCLDFCHKISPGAVIALCQALPQLRNLKLGGACFEDEVIDKIQLLNIRQRLNERRIHQAREVPSYHCKKKKPTLPAQPPDFQLIFNSDCLTPPAHALRGRNTSAACAGAAVFLKDLSQGALSGQDIASPPLPFKFTSSSHSL